MRRRSPYRPAGDAGFFLPPPFALWAQCGAVRPIARRAMRAFFCRRLLRFGRNAAPFALSPGGRCGLFFAAAFCALGAMRRRSPYRPAGDTGSGLRLCAPGLRAWARMRLRACLRQGRAVLRQKRDPALSGAQRDPAACDEADAIFRLFGRNFCVRNVKRRIKNKHLWRNNCIARLRNCPIARPKPALGRALRRNAQFCFGAFSCEAPVRLPIPKPSQKAAIMKKRQAASFFFAALCASFVFCAQAYARPRCRAPQSESETVRQLKKQVGRERAENARLRADCEKKRDAPETEREKLRDERTLRKDKQEKADALCDVLMNQAKEICLECKKRYKVRLRGKIQRRLQRRRRRAGVPRLPELQCPTRCNCAACTAPSLSMQRHELQQQRRHILQLRPKHADLRRHRQFRRRRQCMRNDVASRLQHVACQLGQIGRRLSKTRRRQRRRPQRLSLCRRASHRRSEQIRARHQQTRCRRRALPRRLRQKLLACRFFAVQFDLAGSGSERSRT